ncbi:MAG: glmU [Dehalococcoidia bacterium]|nr:glmU [Dehalococcoidia bacterium]
MESNPDSWAAVILAAGQGVRMRSSTPKVLHPLAGRPMVQHVLDAAEAAGLPRRVVVVGYKADDVQAVIGPAVEYVLQKERLGTAHALLQCRGLLNDTVQNILVVNGDVPLLSLLLGQP